MDVARDVLDSEVRDRNGREMGRVDGILIELEPGEPPRVAAILIGPSVLASRLHPGLGRIVQRLERVCGLERNRPTRIEFADITDIGRTVRLRLAVGDTEVDVVERRLRRWIAWLPGSR